jgi:hypothetical protein
MPTAKSAAITDESTGLFVVLHHVRQLVNDDDGTDKVFQAGDIFDPSKVHLEDVPGVIAYLLAGQDHNGPIIRPATADEAKAYNAEGGK